MKRSVCVINSENYDDAFQKLVNFIDNEDDRIAIKACIEVLKTYKPEPDKTALKWFVDYEES